MEKPHSATNGPVPQHSTFIFKDIEFCSDFDSGNLFKVEKTGDRSFELWVGPDCCSTLCEKSLRTWFYFKVSATGEYTFTLKNLNLQGKLFRDGMKPFIKTPTKSWERLETLISCTVKGDIGTNFEICFTYNFIDSPVFFSFCYPWSYEDHRDFMDSISIYMNSKALYFYTENLINTLEKRICDLITISSYDYITDVPEENIPGLFEGSCARPFKFNNKPIVFISARVHPGETPSSYIVNGLIKFLLSDDTAASQLRSVYVFKIIPMINPDGVSRGYFRTDTRGKDLNRCYISCTISHQPVIYGIKELMKHYKDNLLIYIDCHAHVSKQGCFIYGNSLDFDRQIFNLMFAKLMSYNCPWFSFEACSFNDENSRPENPQKTGKEGCGRAVAYNLFDITRSYTLECNYHSSKAHNTMFHDYSFVMNTESFELIGKTAAISLLYLNDKYSVYPVIPLNTALCRVKDINCIINIENLKLEISKILAEQAPYKNDPDIRKASKSIESLLKYLNNKNKKHFNKGKLINIINTFDKPIKNYLNTSNDVLAPIRSINEAKVVQNNFNRSKEISRKSFAFSSNSFKIRKRTSSYIKGQRINPNRGKSPDLPKIAHRKLPDILIV